MERIVSDEEFLRIFTKDLTIPIAKRIDAYKLLEDELIRKDRVEKLKKINGKYGTPSKNDVKNV